MVDIYVISKTNLNIEEQAPEQQFEYRFMESRENLRLATKEEIESNSENLYFAYKVGRSLATLSPLLPSGRWVVDFEETCYCDLRAISIIDNEGVELKSLEIIRFTAEFPHTMPIHIFQPSMAANLFAVCFTFL